MTLPFWVRSLEPLYGFRMLAKADVKRNAGSLQAHTSASTPSIKSCKAY